LGPDNCAYQDNGKAFKIIVRACTDYSGSGKSTYALPITFHFPLCYVRVLPAEGGGRGKRKVGDVRREVHTFIYPDPIIPQLLLVNLSKIETASPSPG